MFNKDGIRKETYGATRQILADVQNQSAVGCIVDKELGVTRGSKKIVKAGTPININMMNLMTPAKKVVAAAGEGSSATPAVPMNAVLLHDVDVTEKNANGTALVFGFVNVNRVESDVATAITAALAIPGASPLLVFSKQ